MSENNLVSSVFKEDLQMFRQTKTENKDQYKDGMRWEVQDIMQLSKHDLHFFMGTQYQKIPPAKLSCVFWETVKEKMCVQR